MLRCQYPYMKLLLRPDVSILIVLIMNVDIFCHRNSSWIICCMVLYCKKGVTSHLLGIYFHWWYPCGSLGHQVLANPGIYIPMRPVPKVASSSGRHLERADVGFAKSSPCFLKHFIGWKSTKLRNQTCTNSKTIHPHPFWGGVGWPAVLSVFGWYSRPSTLWLVGGRWMLIAGCWWKTRFKT